MYSRGNITTQKYFRAQGEGATGGAHANCNDDSKPADETSPRVPIQVLCLGSIGCRK